MAQRLATLPDASAKAPLWPDIPPSGIGGGRGKLLSKKFGLARLRVLRGLDDGRDPRGVDLHSLRRSFAASLRDAMNASAPSVTASMIDVLMGHSGSTLALRTYAPGALERDKRAAITAMSEVGLAPEVRKALTDTQGMRPVAPVPAGR